MTHPHVCPTCHQPTTPTVLKDVVALRLIQHWATDTICATLTPELTGMHEAIPTGALVTLDGARCRVLGPDLIAAVIDTLHRHPALSEGVWQPPMEAAPYIVRHLLSHDHPFHAAFPNDGFGSMGLTGAVDVYILSLDSAFDILASYDCHPRDPFTPPDYDWSTAWAFSSPDDGVDKP